MVAYGPNCHIRHLTSGNLGRLPGSRTYSFITRHSDRVRRKNLAQCTQHDLSFNLLQRAPCESQTPVPSLLSRPQPRTTNSKPMHTHAKPHTSRRPPVARVLPSLWRCCRPCRPGDAEPRAASWSRRRWLWHWYIQGRQWTPLQRAEWCAALCRRLPVPQDVPAGGQSTSMAASAAARSGPPLDTTIKDGLRTRQTYAKAPA